MRKEVTVRLLQNVLWVACAILCGVLCGRSIAQQRIPKARLFSERETQVAYGAGNSLDAPPDHVAVCLSHLRAIAKAVEQYRKAHGGKEFVPGEKITYQSLGLPKSLADLVPDYLPNRSLLRCPVSGFPLSHEEKLISSYAWTVTAGNRPGLPTGFPDHAAKRGMEYPLCYCPHHSWNHPRDSQFVIVLRLNGNVEAVLAPPDSQWLDY